jgi:predicted DNA-binding protein
MSLALRKSKMVSFRLSLEEYQRFRALCASQGVRSLSDLARTAMQKLVATENDADPLSLEVQDLRIQVRSLSQELDRLSEVVEARRAHAGM